MKRILRSMILVAVIAMFAMPAKSYAGDKILQLGVKAGLNFTGMNDMKDMEFSTDFLKSYTGFNAGVVLRINLPLGFELQPELLYYQSGITMKSDLLDAKANFMEGSLRVPINLQWGIQVWKIKPYVLVSPFIGCSLFQLTNGELGDMVENFETAPENIERMQYGIGVGAGINIWKFQVGFKWNWNLNNLQKEGSVLQDKKFNGGELHLAFIF